MGRCSRRWLVPLVLLGFSAGLLLVCSGTSPLYRGHDSTDANTYLTMGRGLLRGVVPYRDLFDHKGPLLYILYALGALLHPEGFYGVFALQVFALTGTLYSLYRTARQMGTEELSALWAVCAMPVFLLSAGVYYLPENLDYGGGSAEEFCLPFLAGALWLSAVQGKQNRWTARALAGVGALAGAVFQMKFNLTLFFAGLLVPEFFRLFRSGEGQAVRAGGWCVLGFGGSLVPYTLYAGATHSLDAYIRAYFCFNASYARGSAASVWMLVRRTGSAAWNTVCGTPVLAAALTAFFVGIVVLMRREGGDRCLPPFAAFAALGTAVFAGRVMPYTLLPLLLSAFYGFLALSQMVSSVNPKGAARILLVLFLAAMLRNQMLCCKPVFWRAAPTCQEQLAERIRSGPLEEATLLEAGMLSRGFYNQLGLVPEVYYFYVPNVDNQQHPEILQGQRQTIWERKTDYVVLQSTQPVLTPEVIAKEESLGILYPAVRDNYEWTAVVPGTGAVDHLYYHLFQRKNDSLT